MSFISRKKKEINYSIGYIDVHEDFLHSEISNQEMYDVIIEFILSYNIRSGEFECNEYIIKKIDQGNFIIFAEYINQEKSRREICNIFSVDRNNLVNMIDEYAKKIGIDILKYKNLKE